MKKRSDPAGGEDANIRSDICKYLQISDPAGGGDANIRSDICKYLQVSDPAGPFFFDRDQKYFLITAFCFFDRDQKSFLITKVRVAPVF